MRESISFLHKFVKYYGIGKDAKPKKKKNAAQNLDCGTMNLISGLTVLRFTSMLGMRNVHFTKEELLKFNKQLNKINKKS